MFIYWLNFQPLCLSVCLFICLLLIGSGLIHDLYSSRSMICDLCLLFVLVVVGAVVVASTVTYLPAVPTYPPAWMSAVWLWLWSQPGKLRELVDGESWRWEMRMGRGNSDWEVVLWDKERYQERVRWGKISICICSPWVYRLYLTCTVFYSSPRLLFQFPKKRRKEPKTVRIYHTPIPGLVRIRYKVLCSSVE